MTQVTPRTVADDLLPRWLHEATAALAVHADALDAINVFPVPDSDTGQNAYLTVKAAADSLADGSTGSRSVRAMMMGAQGNSGSIIAQFFRGWTAVLDAGELTADYLSKALAAGAERAWQAVQRPEPGTILSVCDAASRAAAQAAARDDGDLCAMYRTAWEAAMDALRKTPEELAALKVSGYVDAGAAAWMVIWDALGSVLEAQRPALPAWRTAGVAPCGEANAADAQQRITDGYEVLLEFVGSGEVRDAVRERLSTVGDSIVVMGDETRWRIHVHVRDADVVHQEIGQIVDVLAFNVEPLHPGQGRSAG